MENAKTLNALDDFAKAKPKDIPRELDEYLRYVATTGDPVYQWSLVKILFRQKLLNVIMEFNGNSSVLDIPLSPNLDPFNFENMKKKLLERYDTFSGVPFTIQRLAELLIAPKKQYSRLDKYMRALEKNIWVVSTRETALRELAEQTSLLNGTEPAATANNTSSPPDKLKRQPEAFDSEEDDEELPNQSTPAEQFSFDSVVAAASIVADDAVPSDISTVAGDSADTTPQAATQESEIFDNETSVPLVTPEETHVPPTEEPKNLVHSQVLGDSVLEDAPNSGAKPVGEEIFYEVETNETSSSNSSTLDENSPSTPEEKDKTEEITVTEFEDEADASSKENIEEVQVPPLVIEPAFDASESSDDKQPDGDTTFDVDKSEDSQVSELVAPELGDGKIDLKRKIEEVIGDDTEVPNKRLDSEVSVESCEHEDDTESEQEIVSAVIAETETSVIVEEVEKIIDTEENTAEVEIAELMSLPETAGEMESVTIEEKTEMVVEEADLPMDVDETSVTSPMAQEDVAEPMEASELVSS